MGVHKVKRTHCFFLFLRLNWIFPPGPPREGTERTDIVTGTAPIETCPQRRYREFHLPASRFLFVGSSAISRLGLPVLSTVPAQELICREPGQVALSPHSHPGESWGCNCPPTDTRCDLRKQIPVLARFGCLAIPKPRWFKANNFYLLLTSYVMAAGWLWLHCMCLLLWRPFWRSSPSME